MEQLQDLATHLTKGQFDYLRLRVNGMSGKQAQRQLRLAPETIETTWAYNEEFQRVEAQVLANAPYYKAQFEELRKGLAWEVIYNLLSRAPRLHEQDIKTQKLMLEAAKYVIDKEKKGDNLPKRYEDKLLETRPKDKTESKN